MADVHQQAGFDPSHYKRLRKQFVAAAAEFEPAGYRLSIESGQGMEDARIHHGHGRDEIVAWIHWPYKPWRECAIFAPRRGSEEEEGAFSALRRLATEAWLWLPSLARQGVVTAAEEHLAPLGEFGLTWGEPHALWIWLLWFDWLCLGLGEEAIKAGKVEGPENPPAGYDLRPFSSSAELIARWGLDGTGSRRIPQWLIENIPKSKGPAGSSGDTGAAGGAEAALAAASSEKEPPAGGAPGEPKKDTQAVPSRGHSIKASELRQIAEAVRRQGNHGSCYTIRGAADLIRRAFELGAFQGGPRADLGDRIRECLHFTQTLLLQDVIATPLWIPAVWYFVVNATGPKLFSELVKRIHEYAKVVAKQGGTPEQIHFAAAMPGIGKFQEAARRGWQIHVQVTKAEVAAVADIIDREADRIEAEHSRAAAPGSRQVFMSDAPARQQLVDLIRDFLRWLPNAVKILPNVNYRRYRLFKPADRDQAAAIVAGVAAFLPAQAVLIQRAMDRFYGTADRGFMPPSPMQGMIPYRQVVLKPLGRYASELAVRLAEVRDWIKKSTPPTSPVAPGEPQAVQTANPSETTTEPPATTAAGKTENSSQVEQPAGESPKTRTRRSTAKGDAEKKLIAALTACHEYTNGGCSNFAPIGVRELARKASTPQAKVSAGSATAFFKKYFKGHDKYKAICSNFSNLVFSLKLLNGEVRPEILLYGSNPPGEGRMNDGE